jgi:putative hydrolase of the HAD superfamily
MSGPRITTLFTDIGGVLLTNGWDRKARKLACETFKLDYEEVNERHHLTFDTYEEGKLSLDEYLARVVFYEGRSFSADDFKTFMFEQSQPYPEMLDLLRKLKVKHGLLIAAVSNEGRELIMHRIRTFDLRSVIDFFIVSSFVHFRKPDVDIFKVALDIAQTPAEQVAYLEDRAMFVDVAATLGLQAIHHVKAETTIDALAGLGLA